MRLIGMLDSPYVRRVAVSLDVLGVPFTHESVSVFSTFEKFRSINPVVKAPSLVCDDGEVLMDSSLILQFVEASLSGGRTLWSSDKAQLQRDFRAVSLALAAGDKSVQIVYERKLRPAEAQYAPWIARVTEQVHAAFDALEQEVQRRPSTFEGPLNQAAITTAIVWQFTQAMLADVVPAESCPGLVALSARLEATEPFLKYLPDGPGV